METNKNRNISRLLYGLACCCVCCIILPGIAMISLAKTQYGDWQSTQGKIIDTTYCGTYRRNLAVNRNMQEDPEEEAGYYIAPARGRPNSYEAKPKPHYSVTYSFVTLNGQQVTATTTYCYNPVPPLGATETILYDPDSPTVGVTSEERKDGLKIGGTSMIVLGIISTGIIGVWLFFVSRQIKRDSNS